MLFGLLAALTRLGMNAILLGRLVVSAG